MQKFLILVLLVALSFSAQGQTEATPETDYTKLVYRVTTDSCQLSPSILTWTFQDTLITIKGYNQAAAGKVATIPVIGSHVIDGKYLTIVVYWTMVEKYYLIYDKVTGRMKGIDYVSNKSGFIYPPLQIP